MKYIIIILALISFEVYSQTAIKVTKTDSDSLWQDFKWMYPDIKKDQYTVVVNLEENIIFYREFACFWENILPEAQDKIRKRLKR